MGVPVKIMVKGSPVFLCCDGCKKQALNKPDSTLAKVAELKGATKSATVTAPAVTDDRSSPRLSSEAANRDDGNPDRDVTPAPDEELEIQTALAELSVADRRLAERQRYCAVLTKNRLGSMGTPVKVVINGEPVFVCCEGCPDKALAEKAKTLATAKRLVSKNSQPGEKMR
jgi:hypothetical protein